MDYFGDNIQTRNPSEELQGIVVIIFNIDGPTFVNIKKNHHVRYASQHYFCALHQEHQHLTKEERDVVANSFKVNSFDAHPEAILLGALFDSDKNTRRTAVNIIMKDRGKRKLDQLGNIFAQLKVMMELVDLSSIPNSFLTEPPLTFDIKEEEFLKCIEG
uniref:Uncharacterized protein n=1 Tax=Lepeophtheirus salmonis TaxID=72036 RepID=A0A0K2TBJ3_LEPSM